MFCSSFIVKIRKVKKMAEVEMKLKVGYLKIENNEHFMIDLVNILYHNSCCRGISPCEVSDTSYSPEYLNLSY
jgi:hypothetical protein